MMKKIVSTIFGCCIIFALIGITPVQAEEFSCENVTEIPLSECEALVDLYNSTNGDDWSMNTNWLVTNTPSNWYGITLEEGHVGYILLINNNLSGSIPPELGKLGIKLQTLDLSFNQLSGSIPPELGNLVNLRFLYLSVNELSGTIPTELGNLENLHFLYLLGNDLSGTIPIELGNLENLKELNLSFNKLTGLIPMNFTKLEHLYIFYFIDTYICEPTNPKFIEWRDTIEYLAGPDSCLKGKKQ